MDQNRIEIEECHRRRYDSYSIFASPKPFQIDGFVTLKEFGLDDEENGLNQIQIEQEPAALYLENIFQQRSESNHFQRDQQNFLEEIEASCKQVIDREKFVQDIKFQEALNNVENFQYLESVLNVPLAFQGIQSQYLAHLTRLSQLKKQQRLDAKVLMNSIVQIGISLMEELIGLMQKASNSWCFEQMKSIPIIKIDQAEDDKKGSRKVWTSKEINLINNSINNYQNQNIPNSLISQLSKQLGRTWCSVQSKIQKLRKNQDPFETKSQSISLKQELKQKSTKYDFTVEDMIRVSLQNQGGRANKQQIINGISQQFCSGQILKEDNPLYRSISITLSSNKTQFIQKIKGTYGLNGWDCSEGDDKVKNKIAWIINNSPDKRATIDYIIQKFTEEIEEINQSITSLEYHV
ncbi:hypothetical protein pb186bvf_009027 [Paramecium bursaria]